MREPFELAETLTVAVGDSYILSYPHLLAWFARRTVFSAEDVVCGAHMVYGWMPTIVELDPGGNALSLEDAALLLTKAKREGHLENSEVENLALLVNNSLVGASKLLHFVAPEHFAIWDSRIFVYIHGRKPHHYQVRETSTYLAYLEQLRQWSVDRRIAAFSDVVCRKIGYRVSNLRALELVMFQNSSVVGT
jgi:hypothetical protein